MFRPDSPFTIYAIQCKTTKRMYIGRTQVEVEERIKAHLTLLRNNKHTSKLFQEEYNPYGEDEFVYYILEEGISYKNRFKECEYMDKYKTCNPRYGYNRQDNHSRARGCIKKAQGIPDVPNKN